MSVLFDVLGAIFAIISLLVGGIIVVLILLLFVGAIALDIYEGIRDWRKRARARKQQIQV